MMARTAFLMLAMALLLSTGCKGLTSCNNGLPFGTSSGCSSCVADCGACGGIGCGECLTEVRNRVRAKLTCGSGCGSLVLDEWFDNPPDCCDPCDNHGGFTGNRVCPPGIHDCQSCSQGPVVGKGFGKGVPITYGDGSVLAPTNAAPAAAQPAMPAGETGEPASAPRASRPSPEQTPAAGARNDVASRPRRRLLFD